MADINDLDVVPFLESEAQEDLYTVYEDQDETAIEREIVTKVLSRLKKNNIITPNTDNEIEIHSELSRIISLYELKIGIPIGTLRPVFESARTPSFKIVLSNGREFDVAIAKKNFHMKNESSSLEFPSEVDKFFSQTAASGVDDGIDEFFRKMEIFLERFGEKQRLVYFENKLKDPAIEIFQDKVLEDDADSFVAYNFLKG